MKFVDDVRARLTDINIQESLRVASRDILSDMGKRIFEQGQLPSGERIGNYSTQPIYISKKDMPRNAGGRDTGKSRFYAGGYKEYKRAMGRGDNFNLRNFGIMQRDFLTAKETFDGKSITLSWKEDRNAEIVESDQRMPPAFKFSQSERTTFEETFNFELAIRLFDQR
jgi:hypothetical protein